MSRRTSFKRDTGSSRNKLRPLRRPIHHKQTSHKHLLKWITPWHMLPTIRTNTAIRQLVYINLPKHHQTKWLLTIYRRLKHQLWLITNLSSSSHRKLYLTSRPRPKKSLSISIKMIRNQKRTNQFKLNLLRRQKLHQLETREAHKGSIKPSLNQQSFKDKRWALRRLSQLRLSHHRALAMRRSWSLSPSSFQWL